MNVLRLLDNFVEAIYHFVNNDDLVKSRITTESVIPANPGSGPGQAPESSYFNPAKGRMDPGFRRADDRRDESINNS